MKTYLKTRLQNRQPIAGCFISIPHPASIEACAVSGIEFVCIDAEHSAVGREALENMIRAAECVEMPSLVRVPDFRSGWIGWALDSGANGIIVPRIETAEDTKAVVSAAYYSPLGSRGVGITRGSSYGTALKTDTLEAHKRTAVVIQIETLKGAQNLEEILQVPGIDAIFIGPFDLELSLRSIPEQNRPTASEVISSIQESCHAAGICTGIFIPNAEDVGKFSEFKLKLIGTDIMHLQNGLRSVTKAIAATR